MFPYPFVVHKRQEAQDTSLSSLPATILAPTASLPSSIGPGGIVTDPSATAQIASADAPSGLTTIVETITRSQPSPVPTLVTTERTRTITDAIEYASITSAEAAAAAATSPSRSSSSPSRSATATTAASTSSSNLTTLIPAIVVPVVVVLVASLGLFWFFMRRRHRRELQSQPEFVMAGKGEKLSSRSSSARSGSWPPEKKAPEVYQKELSPSIRSPPSAKAEWTSPQIGAARSLSPQDQKPATSFGQAISGPARSDAREQYNSRGPSSGMRPATAGRNQPPSSFDREQYRNRSNSNPGQRGPPPSSRAGPSPTPRSGPSPVPRVLPGPSPIKLTPQGQPLGARSNPPPSSTSSAFRLRDPSPTMNHSTRAQAPPRLEAPGAYNGNSSISQYSPIVKDVPPAAALAGSSGKRGPPPPLQTSDFVSPKSAKSPSSASPTGLTEENLRIARFANSARLGYSAAEPSPSPKLPPPATRSQLIPRDSPKDSPDRFFAGSAMSNSRDTSWQQQRLSDRASIVSDAEDYEDIDAKSDVSSLNEFERFDFSEGAGSRSASAAGASLNYFAAQNSPASGRGSPFGNVVHERW